MTDSLKNMLKSVDWTKLMSSGDAKNALVGSALGGLMLGGASLAQDRDPEESKLAPVGDALVGAMLGGAAGYGIPKGLALFRDSGGLAPDGDQAPEPSVTRDLAHAVLAGGAVGAGTLAVKDTPAAFLAWRRLINQNADSHVRYMSHIRGSIAQLMDLRARMIAAGVNTAALDRAIGTLAHDGIRERKVLFPLRVARLHADPRTLIDIIREMPRQGTAPAVNAAEPRGWLGRVFRALVARDRFFTHGSRYAAGSGRSLLGFAKDYGPVMKALLRYRNYGLGGAALGAGLTLAPKAVKAIGSAFTGIDD